MECYNSVCAQVHLGMKSQNSLLYILYYILYVFCYRSYFNGAMLLEMQGRKDPLRGFPVTYSAALRHVSVHVCSFLLHLRVLEQCSWTSCTGPCLLLLLTPVSILCHVAELPPPLASLAIIVSVEKSPTPHIMGWPEAIMELNVPIRII